MDSEFKAFLTLAVKWIRISTTKPNRQTCKMFPNSNHGQAMLGPPYFREARGSNPNKGKPPTEDTWTLKVDMIKLDTAQDGGALVGSLRVQVSHK